MTLQEDKRVLTGELMEGANCCAAKAASLGTGRVFSRHRCLAVRTFERVSGPKIDNGLVKTVGVLGVIGASFIARLLREPVLEMRRQWGARA